MTAQRDAHGRVVPRKRRRVPGARTRPDAPQAPLWEPGVLDNLVSVEQAVLSKFASLADGWFRPERDSEGKKSDG